MAALALLLTGCGGGGSDKVGDQDSPSLPACSDVWKVGATLPDKYDGCTDGGTVVAMAGYDCKGGGQLVAYEAPGSSKDELYAVTGGPIKPSSDTDAYGKVYDACVAD